MLYFYFITHEPIQRAPIYPSSAARPTRRLLLGGLRRLLQALAVVLRGRARLLHHLVGRLLLLLGGDRPGLDPELGLRHGDDLLQRVLGNVLQLGAGGIALLHAFLSRAAGEHDQLRLVQLEALHVRLEAFLAFIPAAVVHCDADRARQLLGNLRLPEFLERETIPKK